jgi:hypothetical protein
LLAAKVEDIWISARHQQESRLEAVLEKGFPLSLMAVKNELSDPF